MALSKIREAVSMLTVAPPPSARALDLTISKRLNTISVVSPLLRQKFSRSCADRNLISSSSGPNLVLRPWRRYASGSRCCPPTIPPWKISAGDKVRAISLAAPPSWLTTSATCWCTSRSLEIAQIMRSCVQLLKLVLLPGSHRGGSLALLPAPPGCHMRPKTDTAAHNVSSAMAVRALLSLAGTSHTRGFLGCGSNSRRWGEVRLEPVVSVELVVFPALGKTRLPREARLPWEARLPGETKLSCAAAPVATHRASSVMSSSIARPGRNQGAPLPTQNALRGCKLLFTTWHCKRVDYVLSSSYLRYVHAYVHG